MVTRTLAITIAAGLGASASAQVFHRVADAAFDGMSDDSRIAVGSVLDQVTYRTSMTWTLSGGIDRIGLDPVLTGRNSSSVISGDGSTVFVGVRSGVNPGYFRYLGPGRIERIVNTTRWQGFGLSDSSFDGRSGAANGYESRPGNPSEAGRWSIDGGTQLLGYTRGGGQSYSTACSSDGNTIVGWSSIFDYNDAFVWTQATGMRILPTLTGGDSDYTQALGVSSNGRNVVGRSGTRTSAVIWRDGVIASLGSLTGYTESIATSVSDNGSVIVGTIGQDTSRFAFVWTESAGIELLVDYFGRMGVSVPAGMILGDFARVSPDGRTIYGQAYSPGSLMTSYVVTIPGPSVAGALFVSILGFGSRRRPRLIVDHQHIESCRNLAVATI